MDRSQGSAAQLREAGVASWQQLTDRYTPFIRGWVRRHGVPAQDIDDLVQDVFLVVVRKLPEFRSQAQCVAFVGWLRAITANCVRQFWRSRRKHPSAPGGPDFQDLVAQQADPDDRLSQRWLEESRRHMIDRLFSRVRPRFNTLTMRAFQQVTLGDQRPADVARELGMTANAVCIAKSRVLSCLRAEV